MSPRQNMGELLSPQEQFLIILPELIIVFDHLLSHLRLVSIDETYSFPVHCVVNHKVIGKKPHRCRSQSGKTINHMFTWFQLFYLLPPVNSNTVLPKSSGITTKREVPRCPEVGKRQWINMYCPNFAAVPRYYETSVKHFEPSLTRTDCRKASSFISRARVITLYCIGPEV